MNDNVTTHERLMGELAATRGLLHEAIQLLPDEEADRLQARTAELAASLHSLWGDALTDHQDGLVVTYERMALMIRHRFDVVEGAKPSGNYTSFCMKCEVFFDISEVACPVCSESKWHHIRRI